MKAAMTFLVLGGLMLAGGGRAASAAPAAETFAKKSGCFTCHAIDSKLVGPSFRQIAARYKDERGAESRLMEAIKNGARGVWGPAPMPANPRIKDDENRSLVQWILSM